MKRLGAIRILMSIILVIFMTTGIVSASADTTAKQAPTVEWENKFGGYGDDAGYSIQQTTDGGYIIAGATTTSGSSGVDMYLIKTDSKGGKQWEKTFGGTGYDYGSSVQQTKDSGYIITGKIGTDGSDVYLVKTDADGNVQWEKDFDGGVGSAIKQTTDGGYIITGNIFSSLTNSSDVYLVKLKPEAIAPSTTIPGTPGSTGDTSIPVLTASAVNSGIVLNWAKTNDQTGLDGYYIYRSESSTIDETFPLIDFPVKELTYTDESVTEGVTYYYIRKPIYDKGKRSGQASNMVSVTMKGQKSIMILTIDNPKMTVNGIEKEIDLGEGTVPVIVKGRTFVPIKAIVETVGGTVNWDGNEKKVTLVYKDKTILLWIGKDTAMVNNVQTKLDSPPFISSTSRTMLPLRFVIQNFGLDVEWDGDTSKITITYEPIAAPEQLLKLTKTLSLNDPVEKTSQESWVGKWDSGFCIMSLDKVGNSVDQISGEYDYMGGILSGTAQRIVIEGVPRNVLKSTFKEGEVSGEFEFTLSEDGNSFTGRSRSKDVNGNLLTWEPWDGTRK